MANCREITYIYLLRWHLPTYTYSLFVSAVQLPPRSQYDFGGVAASGCVLLKYSHSPQKENSEFLFFFLHFRHTSSSRSNNRTENPFSTKVQGKLFKTSSPHVTQRHFLITSMCLCQQPRTIRVIPELGIVPFFFRTSWFLDIFSVPWQSVPCGVRFGPGEYLPYIQQLGAPPGGVSFITYSHVISCIPLFLQY